MMDFNEYGKLAIRTAKQRKIGKMCLLEGCLGLCGEAGEVADIIKKWAFQDHELNIEEVLKEVGDCLWYMNYIANKMGSNLEEVAKMNIEKLEKRYPEHKFRVEDSVKRLENQIENDKKINLINQTMKYFIECDFNFSGECEYILVEDNTQVVDILYELGIPLEKIDNLCENGSIDISSIGFEYANYFSKEKGFYIKENENE